MLFKSFNVLQFSISKSILSKHANPGEVNVQTTDSDSNLCEKITLFRLFSTRLLPIQKELKVFYLLCVLKEQSPLSKVRPVSEFKWMNHTDLKSAQINKALLGLEPIVFFKQIKELTTASNSILESNVIYEPKFVYFDTSSSNPSPSQSVAEQLVQSAKFTKQSKKKTYSFSCYNLYVYLVVSFVFKKYKISCSICIFTTHSRVNI